MLKALIKEIKHQKNYLDNEVVETIYFGGGTPSLLTPDELNRLITEITGTHQVADNAEITVEANPDDITRAQITALINTDVNRLSIGIQSFFDEDLYWMNRIHKSTEAESAVKRAQDAGVEDITIDLIYGYPLLTDEKWRSNLNKAFELGVPHVSAYSMTVEPQTALALFIRNKKQLPMDEQQSARQFIFLMDAMQSQGFEQYEISNFCKPGHYSRHNSNYWKGIKYLGIGPSAHSYNGISRQWNITNNSKYLQALSKNEIPAECETLTEQNQLNEYIMTSLRTKWGLNLDKLNSISQSSAGVLKSAAQPFFEKEWLYEKDKVITLTPSGKLYADHIASELFFDDSF